MKNLNSLFKVTIICLTLSSFYTVRIMSQGGSSSEAKQAELCLNSYVEAFNSDNVDLMVKFYQKFKSPQELEEESAILRAEGISKVKKMMGTLVPDKTIVLSEVEVEQMVKATRFKRWFALKVVMDSENPRYYSGISMTPTKSPATLAKKEAKGKSKTLPVENAKPQTPNPPYPYREELVKITNPNDGIQLAGTLTIPKGKGKHPVICLITGGNPFDRNQTLGDHQPYKVWADHLTRAGYATFRMDDRGIGDSEGDKMSTPYEVLADDVLAAVSFFKNHRRIDAESIGLLGHSQGASIAVLSADKSADIGFLVLLGSAGMTLLDNIAYQQLEESIGNEEINLKTSNRIYEHILQKRLGTNKVENLDDAMAPFFSQLNAQDKISAQAYYDEIKQFLKMISDTKMGMDVLTYHQNSILERTTIPLLAITGSYDGLVINLPSMQQALDKAGNKNYSLVEADNLNHMIQHCDQADQGELSAWLDNEETVNPKVLEMVVNWMNEL